MKIGIDARWILNPEKNPAIGVGHYTYQLIRNLLEIDQKNQFVLFFDYRVREKDVKKFSKPNVEIKYFPWSDYKKYLPGAYSEILGLATLSRNNLDVLLVVSPDARVPIGYHGKVICVFQDLAVFKFPKLFSEMAKIKAKYNRQAMAKRADKIIAVSENTKNDLKEVLNVSAEKIAIIKNGVDERFFEKSVMSEIEARKYLLENFKISKKYILFVGTLEPIKNITRLLQSFRIFKEETKKRLGNFPYQLVLGGKMGWLGSEYFQIAQDLGLERDVVFSGYVEGEDLKILFENCEFFIMPSLHEGFGMSVLEAMACGASCLVSDIPPLKEIAGDDANYFNPLDAGEMAGKMKMMLEDKRENISGRERAKKYSWRKCAEETIKLVSNLKRIV